MQSRWPATKVWPITYKLRILAVVVCDTQRDRNNSSAQPQVGHDLGTSHGRYQLYELANAFLGILRIATFQIMISLSLCNIHIKIGFSMKWLSSFCLLHPECCQHRDKIWDTF